VGAECLQENRAIRENWMDIINWYLRDVDITWEEAKVLASRMTSMCGPMHPSGCGIN